MYAQVLVWLHPLKQNGEQGKRRDKKNELTNNSVDISVVSCCASSVLAPWVLLRLASGLLLRRWRSAPHQALSTWGSSSYSGAPPRGTSSSGNCSSPGSGTSALEKYPLWTKNICPNRRCPLIYVNLNKFLFLNRNRVLGKWKIFFRNL
jgi:hypothetical protein